MASEMQSAPSAAGLGALSDEYLQGLKLVDDAHAKDPNLTNASNAAEKIPYELHYARKMSSWLDLHTPDASPVLQLACRAQHFRRWELPRSSFPMNRPGYLLWRSKQKSQAASQIQELLAPVISDTAAVARIAALIRKEQLSTDAEAQVLEDVACLVFLDDQFDGFESKPEITEEKMIGILRKTWGKMGARGKELALGMDLSERAKVLIGKALETGS